MSKIRIMADSATDITPSYAKELDVSIIPANISFGSESFRDGLDLTSVEFFEKMKNSEEAPKSSQPSPQAFMEEFRKYEDYDDILCLALTSQSSGTYNSACLAKKLLEEENFKANIHIFDTLNASIPNLEMVKIAVEMNKEGQTIEQILEHLKFLQDKMALYFVCDTLEYIKKGGRIGNVKYTLGTILKIKPIITFIKGVATDIDKVRGIEQARKKLISLYEQKAEAFTEISIVHAVNKVQARKLEEEVKAKFKNIKVYMYEVGSSVGTHTGPGAFGIAFREKSPRW